MCMWRLKSCTSVSLLQQHSCKKDLWRTRLIGWFATNCINGAILWVSLIQLLLCVQYTSCNTALILCNCITVAWLMIIFQLQRLLLLISDLSSSKMCIWMSWLKLFDYRYNLWHISSSLQKLRPLQMRQYSFPSSARVMWKHPRTRIACHYRAVAYP